MDEELLREVRGNVMYVTLNRPQARNALTFSMYAGLAETADRVAADPAIRAMVISGAGGRAFAAGTDISQFRGLATPEDAIAYERRIDAVLTRLENCPKPTIAAIAGACTGGGLAIAAACDLRIGAADARIGMPIARTLGNCLSMISYARLTALIGAARVADLIFTARLIDGAEAKAIGFLSEVVDPPEDLPARAEALATTVAGHAPLTLAATKRALHRLRDITRQVQGDDLVTMCFTSEDFREGVEAFLARRPPVWRGR
ncbi:MAG: enoyl-CoA hydratase/isomerase family protein [Thalassobaculales bacterium]